MIQTKHQSQIYPFLYLLITFLLYFLHNLLMFYPMSYTVHCANNYHMIILYASYEFIYRLIWYIDAISVYTTLFILIEIMYCHIYWYLSCFFNRLNISIKSHYFSPFESMHGGFVLIWEFHGDCYSNNDAIHHGLAVFQCHMGVF